MTALAGSVSLESAESAINDSPEETLPKSGVGSC